MSSFTDSCSRTRAAGDVVGGGGGGRYQGKDEGGGGKYQGKVLANSTVPNKRRRTKEKSELLFLINVT